MSRSINKGIIQEFFLIFLFQQFNLKFGPFLLEHVNWGWELCGSQKVLEDGVLLFGVFVTTGGFSSNTPKIKCTFNTSIMYWIRTTLLILWMKLWRTTLFNISLLFLCPQGFIGLIYLFVYWLWTTMLLRGINLPFSSHTQHGVTYHLKAIVH